MMLLMRCCSEDVSSSSGSPKSGPQLQGLVSSRSANLGLRRLSNNLAQLSLSSFLKWHRGVAFGACDSLAAELCQPQWIM
jgi:hypothetical protein